MGTKFGTTIRDDEYKMFGDLAAAFNREDPKTGEPTMTLHRMLHLIIKYTHANKPAFVDWIVANRYEKAAIAEAAQAEYDDWKGQRTDSLLAAAAYEAPATVEDLLQNTEGLPPETIAELRKVGKKSGKKAPES